MGFGCAQPFGSTSSRSRRQASKALSNFQLCSCRATANVNGTSWGQARQAGNDLQVTLGGLRVYGVVSELFVCLHHEIEPLHHFRVAQRRASSLRVLADSRTGSAARRNKQPQGRPVTAAVYMHAYIHTRAFTYLSITVFRDAHTHAQTDGRTDGQDGHRRR